MRFGFYYFLPKGGEIENAAGLSLEKLYTLGLGHVFRPEPSAKVTQPFLARDVLNGPGGQHGVVVSFGDELPQVNFETQTWKADHDGKVWIGYLADQLPGPEQLERANQVPGEYVLFDDGNRWHMPRAREHDIFEGEIVSIPRLPQRFTRDPDSGEWISGEIRPRYARLWQFAIGYAQAAAAAELNDAGDFVTKFDLPGMVVECFCCNYRVGDLELDVLGLWDELTENLIVETLLDLPRLHRLTKQLQKKSLVPNGGISLDGQGQPIAGEGI